MNNLKKIREIYGATQEHVANAVGVNRVTIANWENGSSLASATNREKLSIFYGIGPEFFYDKAFEHKDYALYETKFPGIQIVKFENLK